MPEGDCFTETESDCRQHKNDNEAHFSGFYKCPAPLRIVSGSTVSKEKKNQIFDEICIAYFELNPFDEILP